MTLRDQYSTVRALALQLGADVYTPLLGLLVSVRYPIANGSAIVPGVKRATGRFTIPLEVPAGHCYRALAEHIWWIDWRTVYRIADLF